MAKEAPTLTVGVDSHDDLASVKQIENDVVSLDWGIPRNTQDITGVDKTARERLLLLGDFSISMNGVFNDATGKSHDVFKTICSQTAAQSDRTVTLVMSGQTLTNQCLLTDYALSRSEDGKLTWKAPGSLNSGTAPTWS